MGITFNELIAVINYSLNSNNYDTSLDLDVSGFSPLEWLLLFIGGRVLLNIIFSSLLRWGMKWNYHLLNRFTSIIHTMISAFIVLFLFNIALRLSIAFYENLNNIWLIHKLAFGEYSTVESKGIMMLTDADILLAFILLVSLLFVSLLSMIRSVFVFVDTFILLPKNHKIDQDFRITNFHESDIEHVKELYVQSAHASGARLTETDFEKFIKYHDVNDFRILLYKGVPIGFYATGESKDTLEEVIVSRDYQNQGLGDHLLNDFETLARKRKNTMITAHFYAEDEKTAKHLSERGWVENSTEGMSQKQFHKYLTK